MENFKEIAEKCLAGELSGRFVCRDGLHIPSFTLSRTDNPSYPYKLYRVGKLTIDGLTSNKHSYNDIIQFIPYEEMNPKQVKIDIPEGKVPVMEQTENGVVITWKEKELTYDDISNHMLEQGTQIGVLTSSVINVHTNIFNRKVEVLRKLIMVRNYLGTPDSHNNCYRINYNAYGNKFYADNINTIGMWTRDVIFAKKEHAEQAIKMLGDELKYLFEPW